jgi:hypothetical protein
MERALLMIRYTHLCINEFDISPMEENKLNLENEVGMYTNDKL